MRNYLRSLRNNKGFTLIELLVVIGILGVLAAVVLTAIDPLEQFARGRDSGRLSTIDQLGHAAQAYFTQNNTYPTADNAWMTTLKTDGDLKNVPSNSAYSANGAANPTSCAATIQNNICFGVSGSDAIVYTMSESRSNCNKANSGTACTNATQVNAYLVWDSIDGRTGLLYSASAPTAGNSYSLK